MKGIEFTDRQMLIVTDALMYLYNNPQVDLGSHRYAPDATKEEIDKMLFMCANHYLIYADEYNKMNEEIKDDE